MAYKIKPEYKGQVLNFPELRRKIDADTISQEDINMLMRKGHGGYFESEEPVELSITLEIEPKTEEPGNAEAGTETPQEKEAGEVKAENPEQKNEEPEKSESTASTSAEVKKGGKKRGPKSKK